MRVFILICAVILLTSAQIARSSPLEIIENNEVPVEGESENLTDSQDGEIIQNEPIAVESNSVNEDEELDDDDDDVEYIEEEDPEMIERTTGIEIQICAENPDIIYPLQTSHPTDCSKFYKCSNGRGYLFDCPSDEVWSVKLDRCDYEMLVGCDVDGTYQYKKIKKAPIQAANDQNDESDGSPSFGDFEIDPRCEGGDPFKPNHLPHPNDCTKFYKCYMGKAYVMKCPKGQHWNARLNRCDHAAVARCSVIKVAAASMAVPYMDISEDKLEKIHTIVDDLDYMIADARCHTDDDKYHPIHFAHPSDCQMFYKCFNNFAYKVSCPNGLQYHARTQACDYPQIAKCKNTPVINVQMASMEIKMPSIPDCSHGRTVNYGMQGMLNRYFSCRNGEVYLMECGVNQFFNPNKMECDFLPADQQGNQQQYQYNPNAHNPNYMNQYPSWNYPNYNNMNSNYPSFMGMNMFDNVQQNHQPMPEVPKAPVKNSEPKPPVKSEPRPSPPVKEPQVIPQQPQPVNPDFPSWLPQPNLNVNYPQFPSMNQPQPQEHNDEGGFDFSVGKSNSRCPSVDDPMNPIHLSHESSCSKFYKCFNGRAFMMDCPFDQEYSDELQRCDFHMFANCDPVELMRRRMQN